MLRHLLVCASVILPSAAFAVDGAPTNIEKVASFAPDTGDVIRIESAEYLRTYSQEIAAAACFLHNDIESGLSRELLQEARAGFDMRVDALLNGNEALGIIGGVERKKTIVKIEDVNNTWAEMATAVDAIIADPKDSEAIGIIKAMNMTLLDKADVLVTAVEGDYANPAVLMQADVLLLEVVGRSALMTQKIAKNACKIFTGNTSDEIKGDLNSAMSIYEASLDALINGMPAMSIRPAPTPEILKALEAVQADWKETREILDVLLAGETIDRDTQVYLFRHMIQEMARLEDISHAYAEFSKHES